MATAVISTYQNQFLRLLELDKYEVSKTRYGGDAICQLTIVADKTTKAELVSKLLGCRVTIPYGSRVWKGYISDIEFSAGLTTSYRMSLADFGNRLRVKYDVMSLTEGLELLSNRSFELLDVDGKPTSWDLSESGWAISTSDFYHGKNSLALSTGGSVSTQLSRPEGGIYLLSFWYKNDIQVTLADSDNLDGADNPVIFFDESYTNASWTQVTVEIPVPVNTESVVLTFLGNGNLDVVSCFESQVVTHTTDWTDDFESQDRYGIIEKEYDFTAVVSNESSAIAYRDTKPTTPSLIVTGFGTGDDIILTCVGRVFDLNRVLPDYDTLTYTLVADATTTDDTINLADTSGLDAGDSLFWTDRANVYEYVIDSVDTIMGTVTFTDTLDVDMLEGDLLYRYTVADLATKLITDAGLTVVCPDILTVVENVSANTTAGILQELLDSCSTANLIYKYIASDDGVIVIDSNKYLSIDDADYIITEFGYIRKNVVVTPDSVEFGYFRDSDTGIALPRFLVDTVTWIKNDTIEEVELSIANVTENERFWRYVVRDMKEGRYGMDYV